MTAHPHFGTKPRRRASLVLTLATTVCLLVTACSGDVKQDAGSTASRGSAPSDSTGGATEGASSAGVDEARQLAEKAQQAPASITQTIALAAAPPVGKSIIFVRNAEPATTQIVNAAKLAAESVGWDFSVVNYDAANPATLQAALMTALAKKPTYVMETGTPQSQFGTSVIEAYKRAGVKLIVGAAEPYEKTETVIGNPLGAAAYAQNGKDLADWFIADSNGKGHAVLESVSVYPVYLAFRKGFTDEVDRLCPNCKYDIVTITPAQAQSNAILPALISKMRSTPGIGYAFFDNGQYANGATAALAAAGLKNIKIGGEAINQQGIEAVRAGTNHAWGALSFFYLGYALVDVAVRDITNSPGADLDSIQPRQLITKSNVDTLRGDWNLPADALSQFQKLWNVTPTECKLACG